MPGAAFHSQYWAGSDGAPSTVVAGPSLGGYPAWQTTIIIGGGFGAAQTLWEWLIPAKELSRGDE